MMNIDTHMDTDIDINMHMNGNGNGNEIGNAQQYKHQEQQPVSKMNVKQPTRFSNVNVHINVPAKVVQGPGVAPVNLADDVAMDADARYRRMREEMEARILEL